MRDRGRIALGFGVVLALVAFPLWQGLAAGRRTTARPALERATGEAPCVEDTTWMKAHHEDLLNAWRTAVVRDGQRYYTASSGQRHEMSLTGTCLKCHANSDAFCERCHRYAGVELRCWSCHVQPEGS
jgi:cytochrome c